MHSLVVHCFSTSPQQHVQPPIPEARLLPCQLNQARAQWFIAAPGLVAVTRYRHRQQSTRPPLAEGIFLPHLLDSAFSATSSTRFFELPTATLLCRDLDPPPTFAASCSHPATAWLPVPGSHPSRRISPSRHRSCVSISPLLEQHLPPYALPPAASTPRSSALPCACSSTYTLPPSSTKSYSASCGKRGSGQNDK